MFLIFILMLKNKIVINYKCIITYILLYLKNNIKNLLKFIRIMKFFNIQYNFY